MRYLLTRNISKPLMLALISSTLFGCGQYNATHSDNSDEQQKQENHTVTSNVADVQQQEKRVKSQSPHLQNQAVHLSLAPAPQTKAYRTLGNSENYAYTADSAIKAVSEFPVSTFSADVDSSSYANMRRFINQGRLPPKASIRTEELINYFSYDYAASGLSVEHPIGIDTQLTTSPWNSNNQIIRIGINTYQESKQQRPVANIVFLVDVSGSMQSKEKLPLLKQSMLLMIDQLKNEDKVSIVSYASGTNIVLASTPISNKFAIENAINNLSAGGSTHGEAGIDLAYQQAQHSFVKGGINHVYLMSDGDLNVGLTNIDELKHRILQKRQAGIHFSTLGVGQGNYNDHLMEQLAASGNGISGYIDSLHEAQKLLVDQLGSSLQVVAHDVKFQVEFNSALVSEYRLLGYENRQLDRADFNNDAKDAGDIGAGHSVTALYEITPVGNPGLIDPLVFKARTERTQESDSQHLAEVRVRYKKTAKQASIKHSEMIDKNGLIPFNQLSADDTFAIAVAAFAQKLRANEQVADLSYSSIIDWANKGKSADRFGYRAEFVKLARLSRSLAKQQAPQHEALNAVQQTALNNRGNTQVNELRE